MKIGIIIQARMGSTRLPGKIMRDLSGHPMLWHVVERCRKSRLAQRVVVATTTLPQDDQVAEWCEKNEVLCFRGSETDVLNRYASCAKLYGIDVIVRVTSDCPFIDPVIIDESIRFFADRKVDYVSNCLNRIFPRGLDCEVFLSEALDDAQMHATAEYDREHVTPYIIAHRTTAAYTVPDSYLGSFRLTVDTEDDYRLAQELFNRFYQNGSDMSVPEVIRYLAEHPDVARINAQIEQKASIG